jgi:flagellar basal body-associated protein FliL
MAMEDDDFMLEEEGDEESEEKKPKRNEALIKLLIRIGMIVAGVLVLILLQYIIASVVINNTLSPYFKEKKEEAEGTKPREYYELGQHTFKLQTGCGRIFFQNIVLGFNPQDESLRDHLKDKQMQLTEIISNVLMNIPFREIRRTKTREQIKYDLIRQINDQIHYEGYDKITNIYFIGPNPFRDPNDPNCSI